MFFCKYRDIFGVPGEGVHAYRLFGVAILDVVGTIVVGYVLSEYYAMDFATVTASLFATGVVAHWLFCVDTTLNKWLLSLV
jgi:hypothetical protein